MPPPFTLDLHIERLVVDAAAGLGGPALHAALEAAIGQALAERLGTRGTAPAWPDETLLPHLDGGTLHGPPHAQALGAHVAAALLSSSPSTTR